MHNFSNSPNMEQDAGLILNTLSIRHQLLESLQQQVENVTGESQLQLQEQIDDLKQQQIDSLDSYKSILLFAPTVPEAPESSFIDEQSSGYTDINRWKEQFADGFINFLENGNSSLYPIWLQRDYDYPNFIGFDIRRLSDNFEFYSSDACWLAVFLSPDRRIFAGFHTRNPFYYQQLESNKWAINGEFSEVFRVNLGWKPSNTISRIVTLVGVYNDDYNDLLFQPLQQTLEKLDDIFRTRLETMNDQQSFFRRHSRNSV